MVQNPLPPNVTSIVSHCVSLNPQQAMKMTPLTMVQVAIKNNIGVHYFSTNVPMNVLFVENGNMGKLIY